MLNSCWYVVECLVHYIKGVIGHSRPGVWVLGQQDSSWVASNVLSKAKLHSLVLLVSAGGKLDRMLVASPFKLSVGIQNLNKLCQDIDFWFGATRAKADSNILVCIYDFQRIWEDNQDSWSVGYTLSSPTLGAHRIGCLPTLPRMCGDCWRKRGSISYCSEGH